MTFCFFLRCSHSLKNCTIWDKHKFQVKRSERISTSSGTNVNASFFCVPRCESRRLHFCHFTKRAQPDWCTVTLLDPLFVSIKCSWFSTMMTTTSLFSCSQIFSLFTKTKLTFEPFLQEKLFFQFEFNYPVVGVQFSTSVVWAFHSRIELIWNAKQLVVVHALEKVFNI